MAEETKGPKIWVSVKRRLVPVILALIAFFIVFRVEYIPGAEVTVVDSETKEPIEGVLFLGIWVNHSGSFGGSDVNRILEVKELVSDSEGKVKYSGWFEIMDRFQWIRHDHEFGSYAMYKYGFSDKNATYRFKDGEIVELSKAESSSGQTIRILDVIGLVDRYWNKIPSKCKWELFPKTLIERTRLTLIENGKAEGELKGALGYVLSDYSGCPSTDWFMEKKI